MKAAMALAFCKECLGWNATHEGEAVIDAAAGKWLLFGHLDDVRQAAEEWLQNRGTLMLTEGWTAEVRLENVVAEAAHPDPCFAILAACVKAQHKL